VNLVISNVPGPRNPLFLAGAKLEQLVPVSVVIDGVGLNMTVMSYRDNMDLGVVTDRNQIRDPWPLVEGWAKALDDMEAAVGGAQRPRPRSRSSSSRRRVPAGRDG
jgi:diacylglycerol O-acyltransferase / wax synthase